MRSAPGHRLPARSTGRASDVDKREWELVSEDPDEPDPALVGRELEAASRALTLLDSLAFSGVPVDAVREHALAGRYRVLSAELGHEGMEPSIEREAASLAADAWRFVADIRSSCQTGRLEQGDAR